jgi:hypothetical protein
MKKDNGTTKYFVENENNNNATQSSVIENTIYPNFSIGLSKKRNYAYRVWYDTERKIIHEILQHFSIIIQQLQNNKYFELHFQPVELLKSIIHFIYRTSPTTHPLKINYQKLSS